MTTKHAKSTSDGFSAEERAAMKERAAEFQDAGKFNYRYSTLNLQDAANLDDGDLWPVSYALRQWTPAVEKRVVELVNSAIS